MEKRLAVYYLNKNIFESGDIISFNLSMLNVI